MRGLVLACLLATVACGAPQDPQALTAPQSISSAAPAAQRDVVDELVWTSEFNTFVQALTSVEAVATLKSPGPFTLFAPTDAATQATPVSEFVRLFEPAHRTELAAWVDHHMVTGAIAPGDLRDGGVVTASGAVRTLRHEGGTWHLDGAPLGPPLACTNGIIYPVLPKPSP